MSRSFSAPSRRALGALVAVAALGVLVFEAPAALALSGAAPGVVFSPATSTTPIATSGANGATSGLAGCPAGTAMIGAQTTTTQSPNTTFIDYPYKFTPTCAALTTSASAVVPKSTTVAGALLQSCTDAQCAVVNGKPSLVASVSCPTGAVVTQFEAVTGFWADDFVLGCQSLGADGAPTGTVTWLSRLGGNHNPSAPSAPDVCPAGAVAVGLGALTGDNYFEQPYLSCSALTVNESVAFYSGGGTSVASQIVQYGHRALLPKAPKKQGFTFAGWFTALSGGTRYVFADPIRGDVSLYAHWTAIPVKHPVGPSVDTGAGVAIGHGGSDQNWPLGVGLVGAAALLLGVGVRFTRLG